MIIFLFLKIYTFFEIRVCCKVLVRDVIHTWFSMGTYFLFFSYSAKSCEIPSIPVNGRLLDMPCRDVDCTISFGCEEGYWYEGSALRTCKRDLQWSGTPGQCVGEV